MIMLSSRYTVSAALPKSGVDSILNIREPIEYV